jgi:HSP20 family molecular chaperone IbpA
MNPTNQIVTTSDRELSAEERSPLVYPPVDVYENEEEFLLVADLPGVDPEAVTVELEAGTLHVAGKQNPAWTGSLEAVRFERSFRVPDLIASDGIAAQLRAGVLEVKLRKSETAKPRKIPVTMQ